MARLARKTLAAAALVAWSCCGFAADPHGYEFKGGYPTPQTIQKAYDDADLARAIEAYKFFYPSVSILGTWDGNIAAGTVPNKVLLILHGRP